MLNIDLFPTRLNKQLEVHCTWKPDSGCAFLDAFSTEWSKFNFYAFHPFSIIVKITQDQAQGILMIPIWPTQPWFSQALQLLCNQPWILKPTNRLQQHVHHHGPHPAHKLRPMACPLSKNPLQSAMFLQKSARSLWPPGEIALKNNINIVWPGKWLVFCHERCISYTSPKVNESLDFLVVFL